MSAFGPSVQTFMRQAQQVISERTGPQAAPPVVTVTGNLAEALKGQLR